MQALTQEPDRRVQSIFPLPGVTPKVTFRQALVRFAEEALRIRMQLAVILPLVISWSERDLESSARVITGW
jgi:hypothetical protein